jgi:chitinase
LVNIVSTLLIVLVILAHPLLQEVIDLQAPKPAEVNRWSLGYWTPWGKPGLPPSAIQWDGLTHVVYAWALVRKNGTLDLESQLVTSEARGLITTARANRVKTLLGIAQPYWLGQTTNLQSAITTNRSTLVSNIMKVVDTYDFDGVDIDWEPFNPPVNGKAMEAFVTDLRSRLGNTRTLSAAAIITDYEYWGSVHRSFDRIGVMTYDMAGDWSPYAWHNAALYAGSESLLLPQPWSVDLAVKRFTEAGVPAAKLSIGLPFFGHEWTGVTVPGERWVVKPTVRNIPYQSLAPSLQKNAVHWDTGSRVPYVSVASPGGANNRFLSYDNEQSIAEKINYAKRKGLGGWIIWELSGDYIPSQTPNQPLLNVVKNMK